MSVLPDLFPGFGERRIATPGGEIYLRTGGSGAPLLLLHGYPQTHVCWHQVAPNLARYCALVIGLRGYGQSSAPPRDQEHAPYFKRAMAQDCVAVMRAGATIDRRLDETDLAAGRRIACPTFLLWGRDYLGRTGATRLRSGAALGQRRAGRRNYIWSFSRRGEPEGQLCCAGRLPHRTNHYSLEDAENK
jgi:alpha/beta hydrolase fold